MRILHGKLSIPTTAVLMLVLFFLGMQPTNAQAFPERPSSSELCGSPGSNQAIVFQAQQIIGTDAVAPNVPAQVRDVWTGNCYVMELGDDTPESSFALNGISAIWVGSNVEVVLCKQRNLNMNDTCMLFDTNIARFVVPPINFDNQVSSGKVFVQSTAVACVDYNATARYGKVKDCETSSTIDQRPASSECGVPGPNQAIIFRRQQIQNSAVNVHWGGDCAVMTLGDERSEATLNNLSVNLDEGVSAIWVGSNVEVVLCQQTNMNMRPFDPCFLFTDSVARFAVSPINFDNRASSGRVFTRGSAIACADYNATSDLGRQWEVCQNNPPTPEPTEKAEPPATDPLEPGENMIFNGNFNRNFSADTFPFYLSPAVSGDIVNGVFNMTRGTLFDSFNNPMMAILAQNTLFMPPAGTPIEASVKLGNTSNEAKLVSLHVMEFPTEATRQFCVFVVPPNTPMQTYTLQTVTAVDWSNTDLQLYLEDFGEQWLQVDDMSLSYEPNKGITELTCSTPLVEDSNLLLNGDFDYGNIFFGTFGTLATQQVQNSGGFFLEMTTNTVGFDLGALFQPIFFDAPANTPFEVSLILANPTVEAKNVAIRLWDFPNENDQIFCFFQLPANSAQQTYTMQGVSQSEWTNIGFELFLDDGLPSLHVDDISVQVKPNAGITGLNCPLNIIPFEVEAHVDAAQAPELEVAPAEVEVESVTLDVAPVAPEVAAPEVTEEAPTPASVTEEAPAPVVEEPAAPIVTEEAPAPTAEEPVVEEPAVEAAPAEAETDPVIEEAAPVEEAVPAEAEPADPTE